MKLYFTDETGNFAQKQIVVRGGIIIDFNNYFSLINTLRSVKMKYFGNTNLEYKWSDLTGAIYCIENNKPLGSKIKWLEDYEAQRLKRYIESVIKSCYENVDVIIVSVTDSKNYAEERVMMQNQISHIMERFQFYLQDSDDHGIIIFDSINQRKDKLLKEAYQFFLKYHNFVKDFSRITDSLLSDLSDHSSGIQCADYIVGPINAAIRSYDFSFDIFEKYIKPKLRNKNGKYIGYGIKVTPSEDRELETLVKNKLKI